MPGQQWCLELSIEGGVPTFDPLKGQNENAPTDQEENRAGPIAINIVTMAPTAA